jgi:cobaltochelatase CobS
MSDTLAELQRAIGFEPNDPRLVITPDNMPLIRRWLEAQGVHPDNTAKMKEPTLYKAYSKPVYRRAILSRSDYKTGRGGSHVVATMPLIPAAVGEWTCAACGYVNAKWRDACGDCGAAKGERYMTGATIKPPKPTLADEKAAEASKPAEDAEFVELSAGDTLSPAHAREDTPDTEAEDTEAEVAKAKRLAAETLRALAAVMEGKDKADLATIAEAVVGEKIAGLSAGSIPGTVLVSAREVFGINSDLMVPRFEDRTVHVPAIDLDYVFDRDTTEAVLLGFAHNKRVLVSGRHGTGKTSHIEQVAARLNWPFIRVNLDGHISRLDLIGKDAVVIEDGKQVTTFKEGVLPWAMQQPMALCLDEYDAGRPDVMFVLQRLLEANGSLTLTEQNRVIAPHQAFRLFGTANTVGLGDTTGLYAGTNVLNAAQLDRWSMIVRLDYLSPRHEETMLRKHCPTLAPGTIKAMVTTAAKTRDLFAQNKLSSVMSPRTVILWGENIGLLGGNIKQAFKLTFLNKCDEAEHPDVLRCYNAAFGGELREAA